MTEQNLGLGYTQTVPQRQRKSKQNHLPGFIQQPGHFPFTPKFDAVFSSRASFLEAPLVK